MIQFFDILKNKNEPMYLPIIPILSFYAVRNVKMVFFVSFLYGLTTLAVFIQALQGKPLIK